ncbi:MAG: hypothetical protein EWV61_19015 [Microcystis aeruginosa Ma_AC_P_19900807_S300]|nr:MAG: hypothetical protein EWV61_19015 [Microcystis aeruginosa Ma_AC_P_19900807_S300]
MLENELGRARYLLLLMIVGTWQILKQAKLEILAETLPIPILFESRRKKLKRFGSSLLFMLNQQTRCQDNILLTQKFRKFLKP